MDGIWTGLSAYGGEKMDLLVFDGRVRAVSGAEGAAGGAVSRKMNRCCLLPGFADVHVHLREPGFSYKETIRTGTRAAARGGFTAVCSMPNLFPVPDSPAHLKMQTDIIARTAAVRVVPYGAITVGERGEELADMAGLAPLVCAFSDDGCGVTDEEIMRSAMKRAKTLGKLIAAHCEDTRYPGAESEWRQLRRDLRLAAETGCAYHACHISCRESVELMRRAKADGLDVSCETAPHYLVLDESMRRDDGRFKMNPPLRSEADRQALREGLADGTIDMIATDHAPHAAEEKAGGLEKSLNGVVGLETAFAVLYTELVRGGVIGLERLVALMAGNPRRRFGLIEDPGDLTVFDLDSEYAVAPDEFLSMGRSTPFEGRRVYGRCRLTALGGRVVWQEEQSEADGEGGGDAAGTF